MTPDQFVECCAAEKALMLKQHFDSSAATAVGTAISSLELGPAQREKLEAIVDGVLTDVFYTFLRAIDGCASLGGEQRLYSLFDEDGTKLSGSFEGLAFAWLG